MVQVHTVPGAGHLPHLTHPDTYADAISSFITNPGGPAASR
jgi:pimeloyl-ACP methyl ester carboxylesterase